MTAFTGLNELTSEALPRSWVDMLTPYFPGASTELIEQVTAEILHDYFHRSACWVVDSANMALTRTQRRYVIPIEEPDATVTYVFEGRLASGCRLTMVRNVDTTFFNLNSGRSSFLYFRVVQPGVVEFLGDPDEGAVARFQVALEPSTIRLPIWLTRMVQSDIVLGVRAHMYAQPFKPWADRQAAATMLALYERAVSRARHAGQQGRGAVNQINRIPAAT